MSTAYYSPADVAQMLGVEEEKVMEWRRAYRWPHLKIGRQIRFTESDVRAITAQHHIDGGPAPELPDQTALSASRGRAS